MTRSGTLQIASAVSMPAKKILLISPQAWGKMFVAKHHYAVELARLGNEVYFLNPPIYRGKKHVEVTELKEHHRLRIVDHGPGFTLKVRFHVRRLHDLLMKNYVRWLMKKLGNNFDVVWCFEPNLYSNLDWFGAKRKVYHPVDELFYKFQLSPGKSADLVVSVTREILSKFETVKGKKLFINHGISREFQMSSANDWKKGSDTIIGYSGNLLRPDIDFQILKKCIQQMPSARFIFWGNYKMHGSNLEGNDTSEITDFIQFLQAASNVELRGALAIHDLVREYEKADIFIICYDIEKDQSRGTNYHKVMEFLSTGKVIVSNNISTYQNSELLRMCKSRESNTEFPELLHDTIRNLHIHNDQLMQLRRKTFAAQNSYQVHVNTIVEELYNE